MDTFLITLGRLPKYPVNVFRYLRLFTTSSSIIKISDKSPSFFILVSPSCSEFLLLPISIAFKFKAFLSPSFLSSIASILESTALSIILTLVFALRHKVISFAMCFNKTSVSSFTPRMRMCIFLMLSLIFSIEIILSICDRSLRLLFRLLKTHLSDISILTVKSLWSKCTVSIFLRTSASSLARVMTSSIYEDTVFDSHFT